MHFYMHHIPISIASGDDVDSLGFFPSSVCVIWVVLGKVAELSTSETIQISHVLLLPIEGCSLYRLVDRGLEAPFVLAWGFVFLHKVGASQTLFFFSSVLFSSLLLNVTRRYQIFN
jgi:hypothetical protein